MAKTNPNPAHTSFIDPKSGFCAKTKIYHSLRPNAPLPPQTASLSATDYLFSLLHQNNPSPETTAGLIDAATGSRITCSEIEVRVKTLAYSLRSRIGLSKGDSAFILSPNSVHIPILYLSLFSIGVIVSPSNPTSSESEVSHQINLCKPAIAFATAATAHKLPQLRHRTILLDSAEFDSLLASQPGEFHDRVEVLQSDPAAILYSSGTTGRVKGVVLTHRNIVSYMAAANAVRPVRQSPPVMLCTVPYFHAYGFLCCLRVVAMGDRMVWMERFDMGLMMKAIQEFRVTHVALAPPVVVAMVKIANATNGYDLSSLEVVSCGAAPLPKAVFEKFKKLFPTVQLAQGFGMTEATAGVTGTMGPKESQVVGATGRLASNCQAKIVDPTTAIALHPLKTGELWLRGPCIMKGYVDDEAATAAALDSEGWLRTGDLCYFDHEGFLFFVDRIKELIKYKGYQVAPAELEHLLHTHPDIVDAAVIPYPDEEAGQVPMAFVVRRSGSTIGESQIMDFVAKQVAPFKKIRRVSFVNSLPKNATGKLLRKELIKLALSSASSKL
ncbi:4-coumarate--CoA ligase-like 9 isoform X2 [Cornus florida]|uniref:4-coumarate--CoA ligase-like 9 isoform X2 n=1 Tax=Cornus florida TaxID=4283 RepID=UPI0028A2A276|nr:4-coumarate--CoA ligase-like 9 isoform X2 [Cornus florida]